MKTPHTKGDWTTEPQDDGSHWVLGPDPQTGKPALVAACEMEQDAEYIKWLHNGREEGLFTVSIWFKDGKARKITDVQRWTIRRADGLLEVIKPDEIHIFALSELKQFSRYDSE